MRELLVAGVLATVWSLARRRRTNPNSHRPWLRRHRPLGCCLAPSAKDLPQGERRFAAAAA